MRLPCSTAMLSACLLMAAQASMVASAAAVGAGAVPSPSPSWHQTRSMSARPPEPHILRRVCLLLLFWSAFPVASFYAVWQQSRQHEARRKAGSSPLDTNDGGGVDSDRTSTVIINPMRRESRSSAEGPEMIKATTHRAGPSGNDPHELPPLLAPFLSDFRTEAWYTRHADIALTLLLAALQVRHARCRQFICASRLYPVSK